MKRLLAFGAVLALAACSGAEDDEVDPARDAGEARDGGVRDAGDDTRDGGSAARDGGETRDGGAADAGDVDGGWVPPEYDRWVKFEPEGAVCADGSQYKFFVKFSRTSEDVVIFLEGGGACWDYAGCTGTGIRSAANRDGLPDDHATRHAELGGFSFPVEVVYPLLHGDANVNPMADWNKVFIPYCTGDVYSGDRVATYSDPMGTEPDVEFHHVGHRNIMASISDLSEMFPALDRMFVSGCSAGGAGAIINYHFFRTGLNPMRGYLLDDSGPIYPDQAPTAWSLPLHNRVRQSWNVDPLIQSAPQAATISNDFGQLGAVLAAEYPNDRLALAQFRLDYNYSLYSYERFYELDMNGAIVPFGDGMGLGGLGLDETIPEDRSAVYEMWWDDTDLLRQQFDAAANLGYFMPFYRETNSSHCTTIPGFGEFPEDQIFDLFLNDFGTLAWAGTDMTVGTSSISVRDYVEHMLDDAMPLQSYFEAEGEGRFLSCTPDPMYYDAMQCSAAHGM